MIKLIVGNKGYAKTKVILNMCKEACDVSKVNVVFIEKGNKLIYDVDRRARLIDIEDYAIKGFDALDVYKRQVNILTMPYYTVLMPRPAHWNALW